VRQVLVSHKLRNFQTGDAELDRKLNEHFRDPQALLFEKIRYFDTHTPDHDLTEAEISAGVTPTNYQYPEFDIRRYGASSTADGTANIAAIQAACDVALEKGGGVIKFGPERYNLGTFGSGTGSLVSVVGLENVVFECAGSELFMTATANDPDYLVFSLIDPYNVTFRQIRFIATGTGGATPWLTQDGFKGIRLAVTDDAATPVGAVTFEDPVWEKFTASFYVIRSAETVTRRLRGVRMDRGSIESGYYGPNFQQAGDDFVGTWRCHNILRAYFPYGVTNHDVKFSVLNDTGGFTADACCNIATQPQAGNTAAPRATQGIRAHVTFEGDLQYWSSGGLVVFYHVGATTAQTIADCDVTLNLAGVSNLSGCRPFLFKSHGSSGGSEETSTTANIWRHIHIDAIVSEATLSTTTVGLLHLNVAPTTLSSIHLGENLRLLLNKLDLSSASDHKISGWRFYVGVREFVQFKIGDLTSGNLAVDFSGRDALPFSVKLKIWAKSQRNMAGQDVTYREILVTGYNAGGAGTTISQQDTLFTHSTGTASAFTVAASGETLTVAFTNYSNSQAWAWVAVEHLWPIAAMPN
jgi:hypothetical protein